MLSDEKSNPFSPLKKISRYLITLIVIGLLVHFVLPQLGSLEHSLNLVAEMSYWWVGAALLAEVASYFGAGFMIQSLVSLTANKISLVTGTLINLAGASFGMVAGGMFGAGAAVFKWLQKEGVRPAAATLAGAVPAVFIDLVLIVASLGGLVHLLLAHELTRLQGAGFVILVVVLILLIGLVIIGLRNRQPVIDFVVRMGHRWARFRHQEYHPGKFENALHRMFDATDMLVQGGWRGPLIGATIYVIFDMLALYLIFIATGNPVSFGVLLTGYGLPVLLGKVAFMFPGGIGVVESSMIGLYTSLGVVNSTAVVVVLGYRILSFWVPLFAGFPVIVGLQRK